MMVLMWSEMSLLSAQTIIGELTTAWTALSFYWRSSIISAQLIRAPKKALQATCGQVLFLR
jgi:hypothetical protein